MRIAVVVGTQVITHSIPERSWMLQDHWGDAIDTFTCDVLDPGGVLDIRIGQDVYVEDLHGPSLPLFGGVVSEVRVVPLSLGRMFSITAQDWKMLLDRYFVTKKYVNTLDRAIIQDAFREAGLTEINTNEIESARVIDAITFNGVSLRQVMQMISDITGYFWDVDAYKRLVYRRRYALTAPFGLSTNPDMVSTFPFWDANLTTELGVANEVIVRGGIRQSEDIVEEYSADGNTRQFRLREIIIAPATRFDGTPAQRIQVQVNTGTDSAPVWQDRSVYLEGETPGDVLWIPAVQGLRWVQPPPAKQRSFRVRGRYYQPITAIVSDPTMREHMGGRRFVRIFYNPDIRDNEEALEVARAVLRESGNVVRLHLSFSKDGIRVGHRVEVVAPMLGIERDWFLVEQLVVRPLGGGKVEYRATLRKDTGLGSSVGGE